MSETPQLFDLAALRLKRKRAQRLSRSDDFLLHRAVIDIAERISAVNRSFSRVVVTGVTRDLLATAASKNHPLNIGNTLLSNPIDGNRSDLVASDEVFPFAPASLDMIASVLSLHSINDVPGALAQYRHALKPDGLFVAALLGGQTLTELRTAFGEAELDVEGGMSPRVSPFADVRDMGGLLMRTGFALPVADLDTLKVSYGTPYDLLYDLRAMAQTNVLAERRKTFLRRTTLARMAEIYAERYSRPDGRVEATYEIIYLTGWAPHESQQQPLRPGSAKARLADALQTEETKLND